jgi:hypothetical protein
LQAAHTAAWDERVGAGFEQLAIAPNASADAQLLVRIREVETPLGGAPTPLASSFGPAPAPPSATAERRQGGYRYYRAGDRGGDNTLAGQYQEPEPDGQRFYAELLRLYRDWGAGHYFDTQGGGVQMAVRLPYEDRRVVDMAMAALTAGLTVFRNLLPNYGERGVISTTCDVDLFRQQ